MAQKGKLTKTEIFCLVLTAVFLLVTAAAFCRKIPSDEEGQTVRVWKDTDAVLPEKININTADEAALQTLPGIGPVLARRIVEWRESNGDFVIAEDLLAVEGIGLTKLDEIRDYITVQEAP